MRKTYYTAVGHFRRETNADGQSHPVILINRKEYLVDIQEMAVWTALNWQVLSFERLEKEYGSAGYSLSVHYTTACSG